MSFSFIDIEKEKSRVIAFLFISIILIYFVTAYLLLIVLEYSVGFPFSLEGTRSSLLPPLKHAGIALVIAFFAALFHWSISTGNLIEKLTLAAGAIPTDLRDTYHQYFQNIVEEVSVAIGGRKIEPWIIQSPGMNAFALEDFEGRAIIGITEGLLSRLNRAQIEAVVGHEAGHIASGDCLATTVSCALGEIYEESLARVKSGLKRARGRAGMLLLLVMLVLSLMHFLSRLLRCFISREREFRADAVGVRLTRDPLSLAEALELIRRNWRGEGAQGENLESIFIVNPRFSELDEKEGTLSDLFSTHPPVSKRMNILLSMAHMDEKTLDVNLKNFKRVSPVAKPEFPSGGAGTVTAKKWQVFEEGKWEGPFTLDELRNTQELLPAQWVREEGGGEISPAYEHAELMNLFTKAPGQTDNFLCPNCKVALQEYHYEGSPVLKCAYCQGTFVEYNRVSTILIRQDYLPSDEIERMAKMVYDSKQKIVYRQADPQAAWVADCPKCKRKMRRQFFVYSYPVVIDRCVSCSGVWLDKDELEVLQYIYEHKEKFLYAGSF